MDRTICPRCSTQVYQAEQVLGPSRKIYHKYCFKCQSCNKRLDSNFLEHDSEPYCRQCHRSSFGTRDLRSANLSPTRSQPLDLPSVSQSSSALDDSANQSSRIVEEAQVTSSPLKESQATPLTSIPALRSATSLRQQTTGAVYPSAGASPRAQLTPNYTGNLFGRTNGANGGRINNTFGSSPQCPRCNRAVYFAEQVNAIGKKWHKACLTCDSCKKRLDSFTLQEHDDEPYCKQCYTRLFGTRDLRSANLSPTTIA